MNSMNRRSLFKVLGAGVLTLPFVTSVVLAEAKKCGAPGPKASKKLLDPKDKTAIRLDYVEVASDAKGKPKYKEGDNCVTCNFYKNPEGDYGQCAMAAMKYVAACGWCKQFRKKA